MTGSAAADLLVSPLRTGRDEVRHHPHVALVLQYGRLDSGLTGRDSPTRDVRVSL
ncbi:MULTISPECIES: hypothetical protein [unclassified Frankia]|uniref:hypothetical protein n=1 Tax=unclassified Frankia TaxID=2632575 RepID=UPI00130476E0|nr:MULTISPECIES: hypothetical protein [unclassified Frankia]